MNSVRIGTRGSPLALAQARMIAALIALGRPGQATELVVISTVGDRRTREPLAELGGKGVFIREIEDALLEDRVDLAVHSLKDLPARPPEGLAVTGFPRRADARDLLITRAAGAMNAAIGNQPAPREPVGLDDLPAGARIATGSLRRRAQLAAYRPDLRFAELRGNIDTRLRRLQEGIADGIVLAAAGIERLGLADTISAVPLDESICIPAAGQGIIGVEVRSDDADALELAGLISDPVTVVEACAERAFLAELSGSCLIPAAARATCDGRRVRMHARILSVDGVRIAEATGEGQAADAWQVGRDVAQSCLARGGAGILAELAAGGGAAGPD